MGTLKTLVVEGHKIYQYEILHPQYGIEFGNKASMVNHQPAVTIPNS